MLPELPLGNPRETTSNLNERHRLLTSPKKISALTLDPEETDNSQALGTEDL